ncbi:MAG: N-acetylornithine carbamoyltransferase [Candidatus Gottesmanbacteria bacterium]|nr:N-acetylornithine carbamoyltransferase [Candidatus Gottesmanbacteria bacterium]
MNKHIKHFYSALDYSSSEIQYLVNLALKMKSGSVKKSLAGKTLGMLFFNPSLRTRVSFAVAMLKLGGCAIDLPIKESYTFEYGNGIVMDKSTIEHVKDAAGVLSRYCDALAIRSSDLITTSSDSVEVSSWEMLKKDTVIKKFMEYATVPVINMESNVYHPCQGLGDALTIKEKLGNPKGKKYVLTWAYHPKALPMATPNSQILAACDLGMDVVIANPPGWELEPSIINAMALRAKQSGGSLAFSDSMNEAIKGSDVVCAKSWGALKCYGNWSEEKKLRDQLKHWIVTKEKMSLTHHALFMHCLPVRRNVEATEEVLDSKNSVILDEAENRMWAQMAILETVLGETV